ncbi:MAG: FtsX-like permease family protein [Desulfovibrio sp.]|nr:FtsX-like permease family protein [Desulfovibrio sp.]
MKTNAAFLALKDWLHEGVLSLCGVLALASMLSPLLILHGVHTGVITRMREHLLQDPTVLVLMPAGGSGAGFSEQFIDRVRSRPECAFCMGRTRDVASELQVRAANGSTLILSLEATAQGDPLLARHGLVLPWDSTGDIVLTDTAAKRLAVTRGDALQASISRRQESGTFERKEVQLHVAGILPAQALGTDTGFVHPNLLWAIQDFRDGFASDILQASGKTPQHAERHFESFRAYVRSIDAVASLETWFAEQNIVVKTRSRDIANIKHMDSVLSAIIVIIAVASLVGFFAFMASSVHASVRRKWKMLGMLRLIGYSRWSMLAYPVTQALATGILGVLTAMGLYGVVANIIDIFFASQTDGQSICFIHATHMLAIALGIQVLVVFAALRACLQAARIDPALVIRDS